MYPAQDFNQVIQQEFNRPGLNQVIIEVQETFGDHRNRSISIPRECLSSIEYHVGVLVVSCIHPEAKQSTEFIKWEDIRSIQFHDTPMPAPRKYSFQNYTEL